MSGYAIEHAEKSGYFVRAADSCGGAGHYPIKFAGTLGECLVFVRGEFERVGEVPQGTATRLTIYPNDWIRSTGNDPKAFITT